MTVFALSYALDAIIFALFALSNAAATVADEPAALAASKAADATIPALFAFANAPLACDLAVLA